MTTAQLSHAHFSPAITWEKLPDDFMLPDEPVESNLQPLLVSTLRESLALAGLILESMLIASNFGLCATVETKTVVKAPDWVYIPSVNPISDGEIRRSYTPILEGDIPLIVLEFISETEGGEYSVNPYYPYGKWYFYENILKIPVYGIFQPKTGELDLYRLFSGKYERQSSDDHDRYWLEEINLFLGVWRGKKDEMTAYWLRWWDSSGNLLLWGNELILQERQRTEQVQLALEEEQMSRQKLAEKLRELGVNPDTL